MTGTAEGSSGGLSLFGVTFTGKIIGILIAVAGVGVSIAATVLVTLPLQEDLSQKQNQISQKEGAINTLNSDIRKRSNIAQRVEEAKRQNNFVVGLLPTVDNIDTMMRDISLQVPKTISVAIGPFEYQVQGTLGKFQPKTPDCTAGLGGTPPAGGAPKPPAPAPAPAGAAGAPPTLPPQYKVCVFEMSFEGKYSDILDTIRKIERLKPLLVVKDLKLARKAISAEKFKLSLPVPEKEKQRIVDGLPPLLGADFTVEAYVPTAPAPAPGAAVPPKK
jgi:type IV pilus assembly protein PilO